MGLHCHQRFVSFSDTAITIHGEEISKWADRWNDAMGYLGKEGKVIPLFPIRGQHDNDLPETDEDNWGHNWLTLEELNNADYSKPVVGTCGEVVCSSWAEYLGIEGEPDEPDEEIIHYQSLGATHVFYHFNC